MVRIFHVPGPAETGAWLAGPADLAGKSGTLYVVGQPNENDLGRWCIEVGLFVLRGGKIEHV